MSSSLYEHFYSMPDYDLRHIVYHASEAHHFDKLYKLFSPGFMWAKRIRFGSHQNFAQDLKLTIGGLQDGEIDILPRLIFYGMLYATLRSVTTNVTPDVLRILSTLGQRKRAITIAETIPDAYQRALAYQILGGGGELTKKREENDGLERNLDWELMHRAYSEALQIDKDYTDPKFLSMLAQDLARTGDMVAALSCARQISEEEPYDLREKTLANISVELAHAGKKKEAFQVYEQLEEGYIKTELSKKLVTALARGRLIIDALNMVIDIEENGRVVESIARAWQVGWDWLQNVVNLAKETKDIEERNRFISAIASKIDGIQQEIMIERKNQPNPFEIAKAATEKALTLIWLGRYDDALNILKTIDTNNFWLLRAGKESEFGVFVMGLLSLGKIEAVKYLNENRWTDSSSSDMLPVWEDMYSNLIKLIEQGNLGGVFAAIEAIEPKDHQADAMLLVGTQLAKLGRITDIVDFYKKNSDDGHFDGLAHELATHLANQGMFQEADLLIGKKIVDESVRFGYVFEVAGSLISLGRYAEILPVIKSRYPKTSDQLEIVAYIAEKLALEDRTIALDLLDSALIDLETVEQILEDRAEIFSFIAATLMQDGNFEDAVEMGEHLAREKPDLYSEIIALSVAKSSSIDQAQRLLEKSLDFVETIPDDLVQTLHLERQTILNYLVADLAKRRQFEHAITVTSRMDESFWQKPLALAELAGRLAVEDEERANSLLNVATKMVEKLGLVNHEESIKNIGLSGVLESFVMPKNVQHFAKWGRLNPESPLGFGIGLFDVEAGMSFIAMELVKTGWIEKALTIVESSKDEAIRHLIRTYSAIQLAEHGDSDAAHQLLEISDTTNQNVDNLGVVNTSDYEVFGREMTLRTGDFHRLIESRDIKGAQKLAKNLINGIDDHKKGMVLTVIAAELLKSNLVDELSSFLNGVPDELADKIQVQIASIWYFLNDKNYAAAEKIADTVNDLSWKILFKILVELKKAQADDKSIYSSKLIQFVDSATEIIQITKSDSIRTWLLKEMANGLVIIGETNEILQIVSRIPSLEFRYRALSETCAKLVNKGMLSGARTIFLEIIDSKIRDATITLIVDELKELDPQAAINGFYMFLYGIIDRGYKTTWLAVSQVILLVVKLAGPDHGPKLIAEIGKEIFRVDKFWEQKPTH